MDDQPTEKRKVLDIIKSNLRIIISIFLVFIVGSFFYAWINFKEDSKKVNLSEEFINAKVMLSQNKSNEAYKILKKIIQNKDNTYSVLSLYLVIDQDLEKEIKKVLNYFNEVLSINTLKNEDLDLLKFKKAIFISNDSNEKELLDLLNPIINSDSVWKAQSIRFLADFYFSKKEYKKADQYYSTLLDLDNSNIDVNEIKRKIKTYKK